MKRLFALLVIVIGLNTAKAQTATLMPLVAGDTISASSGLDTVSKVITATSGYSAMGIQVVATKISGTVSLKAFLYSSLDGTNYVATDSSAAFANQTTNTAFFTKETTPYTYYKVQVRPAVSDATTQAVKVRVYYVLRKHN